MTPRRSLHGRGRIVIPGRNGACCQNDCFHGKLQFRADSCTLTCKYGTSDAEYGSLSRGKEIEMETHLIQTTIRKQGYLELKNLPFEEGTLVKIAISKRQKRRSLQGLMANDHVWTDEDIKAVESGRDIINQWKVS